MIKTERVKLKRIVLEYLELIGTRYVDRNYSIEDNLFIIDTERVGKVQVHPFFPKEHKDSFWMACRLLDWPDELTFGDSWKGFRHWKCNFHPGQFDKAEELMVFLKHHFAQFGSVSVKELSI